MSKYQDLPSDVNMSIRIPRVLRDDFKRLCDRKSINSSAFLRNYIIKFVEDNEKENK